ncbi:MAG: TonB-dependent receptor, partial [Dokdonella sp.]
DRRVAVANGITCGGTGRTVSVVAINGSFGRTAGDYRCAVLDGAVNDLYDFSPFNLVLTPSERGGLFVVGNYRLTDTVEGYVEAFTNKTRSRSIIAPLPLILAQLGGPISADGAFNPFIDPTNPDGSPLIDPVTGDPVRADIRSGGLRDVTGGNRETLFDTTAEQISAGLRGSFGDTWQWDAGITFARLSQENASTGYYLLSGLAPAVGPSFIDANGVANCGTVGAPIPLTSCTPINIFNLDPTTPDGAISRAALNALALTVKSKTYANQKTAQFNLTGELFELPAGAVSLAVGGEYRADYTYVEPDFISTITNPLTGRCLTFTDACASPSVGDLSVREFYGELLVPLLRDLPFAKSLNLTLGSRYSDYSAFGNTTNSKIGLEWRPIDDLLLRGTIAEVFRAPTISDLFSGTSTNAATYLDPCDNLAAEDVTNPACAGLVAGFEQITPQTQALNTSNANLLPEKGQTVTWGAVYDPSWLPGLSTSLDVWKVQLSDTIGSLGTQTILDQCFKFGRFCDLFTRGLGPGDTGDVNFVQNQTQQVGRIDTKGIDYSIKYRLPETSFGNFRVSLDTTYIAQYDVEFVEGTISTRFPRAGTYQGSAFGGDGNYARVRALGALSWNMGPFDASWRTRFVSATKFGAFREAGDGSNVVDPTQDPTQDSYRIGGITYHNFAAGYNAEVINTRFDMGVDNVFAKQPPILWQYGFNGNTDERTYDTVGRYYWARVAVKF